MLPNVTFTHNAALLVLGEKNFRRREQIPLAFFYSCSRYYQGKCMLDDGYILEVVECAGNVMFNPFPILPGLGRF